METTTYEITSRDDKELGRLRGISHSLDGQRLPGGLHIRVYEVEARIADLFEADCDEDPAVISYRQITDDA